MPRRCRRRSRRWRWAGGVVRAGGPRAGPRRRAPGGRGVVPGAGGGGRGPDRRGAGHGGVPPSCVASAHEAGAGEMFGMRIWLRVNGEPVEADIWEGESLLYVLRERLGYPGSKNACEQGACGSCSVMVDGKLVCACLVLRAQADRHEGVTGEGLSRDGGLP